MSPRMVLAPLVCLLLLPPLAVAEPTDETPSAAVVVATNCVSVFVGPPPYAAVGDCLGAAVNFTVNTTRIP